MAEPRHLILPAGIVSSSWPAVRDTCARVGITFDEWQQILNRAMFARDVDGFYAADTIVMSICRQSGKTYDVGGVTFADSIINPGTTTVWTAHRFKVARETFNELKALATTPQMSPHVDPEAITTAAGNECIPFRNGSRIVFAARERGAIRGFSKVRRLILDEAQILTEAAMSDLAPTMNQADDPQVVLMGTPPKPRDPSEVFTAIRADALGGKSEGVLYIEYGADPDCELDDWDAVRQANPSFPLRTSKRAILRLRKLLTNDDDYAREGLGIWDSTKTRSVISSELWAALGDVESSADDPVAIAFDVSPDQEHASVSWSGRRPDGRWHIEVLESKPGDGWVVDLIAAKCAEWTVCEVVCDSRSTASALIPDLKLAGVTVNPTQTADLAQACAGFYSAVAQGDLRHRKQPLLNVAVDGARKRSIGDAGWAWNRKNTSVDLTPLVSVTLAQFAHARHAANAPEPSAPWFDYT